MWGFTKFKENRIRTWFASWNQHDAIPYHRIEMHQMHLQDPALLQVQEKPLKTDFWTLRRPKCCNFLKKWDLVLLSENIIYNKNQHKITPYTENKFSSNKNVERTI